MDCRKMLWLGGVLAGGLVGCRHGETVTSADPYNATAPSEFKAKAPAEARPVAVRKSDPAKEVSKVLDAKPESCVSIGDLKSAGALNMSLPEADRIESAQLAKSAYNRAIQLDPKHLPAYLGIARLCTGLGEYDQAMNVLNAALVKFPNNGTLWYERGMCLGRQKQFDEALANLTRAAQIEPTKAQFTKSLGLMLARLDRADEAVMWLTKSMSRADAHYNVARMMEHIGQESQAQRQVQLALAAEPDHAGALAMQSGAPNVRQTAHAADGGDLSKPLVATPGPVIQIGRLPSSLPERPDRLDSPDSGEPARMSPVIPVLSDQWEQKPALPPSLDGPERATKAKPNVQIGFEPNK